MPLMVAFDTGALDDVVWPQSAKDPTDPADAARVRAAVESGAIKGFFGESLITLEGIQKKDRIDVLGSARFERDSWSPTTDVITTTLAFAQDRKTLNPKFAERIRAARKLSMRALLVPRSLGDGVCAKDDDGKLFEPIADLEQFVARATQIGGEIGSRSLGRAAAVKLGLEFSARVCVAASRSAAMSSATRLIGCSRTAVTRTSRAFRIWR
jgi:hypothetical protein